MEVMVGNLCIIRACGYPQMIKENKSLKSYKWFMRIILKTKPIILTKKKIYQLNSTTTLTQCFIELANSFSKMIDKPIRYYGTT